MNLAPNGEETPEQYRLVRTPAFKKWFGNWQDAREEAIKNIVNNDYSIVLPYTSKGINKKFFSGVSKVMGKEPKIVWHGSNNDFNIFDNKSGLPYFYFSDKKNVAKLYGNIVKPYYLNIKNPILFYADCSNFNELGNKQSVVHKLMYALIDAKKYNTNQYVYYYETEYVVEPNNDGIIIKDIVDAEIEEELEKLGDEIEKIDKLKKDYCSDVFIVINPNQIKLADGTNTTFDANNPDIRYEGGGNVGKVPKSEKDKLLKLSIEKYGKEKVDKALLLLYKWTRGDVFRYKISDFEPLSLFKPKVLPKKLYKGIQEKTLGMKGWSGRDKDYFTSIKKSKQFIIDKYKDKLSSWTTSPSVASKFATSNGVLILENPTNKEIFIDVTLIPNDYKFSGYVEKNKMLLFGSNIFVPDNEKEMVVILNPTSIKKIKFHEVHFSYGEYLGDYKVDTLGLTKSVVRWHVSPFNDGGEITLTTEQVEQKLGRKLHWWNDDVVSINGVEYKKVFLKSEYKRNYYI